MAKFEEINIEYIGGDFSSRSIHELEGGVSYYNYEGTHFRVFETFNNAKAFLNGEPVKVIAEFDLEDDLDRFLNDTEVCSVCNTICFPDDECYEDADTGNSCCTKCCFFDESIDMYRAVNETDLNNPTESEIADYLKKVSE